MSSVETYKNQKALFQSKKLWLLTASEAETEFMNVWGIIAEHGMEIFDSEDNLQTDLLKEDFREQFNHEEITSYEVIEEMRPVQNLLQKSDTEATQLIKVTCKSGHKYTVRFFVELGKKTNRPLRGTKIMSYFVVENRSEVRA